LRELDQAINWLLVSVRCERKIYDGC
jgi:hypothetical protein